MGMEEVFSMTAGTGEASYATNSSIQRNGIEKVRPLIEESIKALCSTTNPDCLTVADLGCSSGPNALGILQSIVNTAVSTCRSSGHQIPELNVLMNDLPQNDFNTIFKSVPGFYQKMEEEEGVEVQCFISGTPGSFYGRLFPSNSINFVHSSYSLHWLSKVPEGVEGKEALNKGLIYVRKGSPPKVLQAYREQFAQDFTMFLRCRSKEIVHGGRMVLNFMATHDDEMAVGMESTSKALNKLASEGLIDKEKLDGFNLPYYRPTIGQVKQLVEAEGSFALHKLDTFNMPWDAILRQKQAENVNDTQQDVDLSAISRLLTGSLRAITESLLVAEFGEEIIDHLFGLVQDMITQILIDTGDREGFLTLLVSLIRN